MFIKIYLLDLIIRICAHFSARLQGGFLQKVTAAAAALHGCQRLHADTLE